MTQGNSKSNPKNSESTAANKVLDSNEPPRYCRRLNILREYDNEKTNLHS